MTTQSMPIRQFLVLYKSTYVDYDFQRNLCWDKSAPASYLRLTLNRHNCGTVIVAKLPSFDFLSNFDKDTIEMVKRIKTENMEYDFVSLDGNHRGYVVNGFCSDEFGISVQMPGGEYATTKKYTKNQKFSEWDELDQMYFLHHCTVTVDTIENCSRSQMGYIFGKNNEGSSLSNQESRNALGNAKTSKKLREYGNKYFSLFKTTAKRSHEELTLFILMILNTSPESLVLNKRPTDEAISIEYNNDQWGSLSRMIERIKAYMIFKGMTRMRKSYMVNMSMVTKLLSIENFHINDNNHFFDHFMGWCYVEEDRTAADEDGLKTRNGGHGERQITDRRSIFTRYIRESKEYLIGEDIICPISLRANVNTPSIRRALIKRQNNEDPYSSTTIPDEAHIQYTEQYSHYHVDHIIPVRRGGSNVISNLQLTLVEHNLAKGRMTDQEYKDLLNS